MQETNKKVNLRSNVTYLLADDRQKPLYTSIVLQIVLGGTQMDQPQEFVTVELNDDTIEVTPVRQSIIGQLIGRSWFQNTAHQLQLQLVTLPEKHNGFLSWLSQRPEVLGGKRIVSLFTLFSTGFTGYPVFELEGGQKYELHSWRMGPDSGTKALVLLHTGKTVTHFVVTRGESFATGQMEWGLLGGFKTDDENANQTMLRELEEETGSVGLLIRETFDFGQVATDPGMTNNRPHLGCIVVQGNPSDFSSEYVNLDLEELEAKVVVLPIEQIFTFAMKCENSYINASITLARAYGAVKL